MLYWQLLCEAAPDIQGKKGKAATWARKHLRGFFANGSLDWDHEWERFDRYLRALVWLVTQKNTKQAGNPPPKLIPPWIDKVLAETVRRIQNRITGDTVHELTIDPVCTNASGQTAEMHLSPRRVVEDFTVFWQVAFIQFLDPTFIKVMAGVCAGCGKLLPPTKSGRPRRAKHCGACSVKMWRHRHPDAARAMWRKDKARQREEAKQGMSCHSPKRGE